MDIYYMNHKNQKIDFMKGNYNIEESSFFSHLWEYETQKLVTYGEKIIGLNKKAQERKFVVHIEAQGIVSCEQSFNNMLSIFEADVFQLIPGTLYIDEAYIRCYVIANEPKYFVPGIGSISCELCLIIPYPFWINEQKIQISPISADSIGEGEEGIKTYPYTYSYKYPLLQTETLVDVEHYTDSDFKLIAYGPTTSVNIEINDHPYIVEYPLEKGEYMVIDSRQYVPKEERLYVVRANGEKENIFNYRGVEHSVFKKIPSGQIRIDYPRTYGLDLIIFKERSEPPWKS